MKSMKGRLVKKLSFFPSMSTLKHGFVSNSTEKFSYQNLQMPPIYLQGDFKKDSTLAGNIAVTKHGTELKDVTESETFFDLDNVTPSAVSNDRAHVTENSEDDQVSKEIAVKQDAENEAEKENEEHPFLSDFEEKCTPGGSQSVILYTTSLRSIRKTFEDGRAIRFLLESCKIMFCERDVSLHLEFREELWRILGGRVIPPRLFINGRYIGGADEVVGLNEQGKLKKLLAGTPLNLSNHPCTCCGNVRFLVCSNCNGSCKVFVEDDEKYITCPECNENGLAKCPICS